MPPAPAQRPAGRPGLARGGGPSCGRLPRGRALDDPDAGLRTRQFWPNGSAGVDIFFVISGLVMTISVQRNAGRDHPAWTFAKDRIIRIVPLYWIVTTVKIAAVVAVPALATRTSLDPLYVAGSYALLPLYDGSRLIPPVLPVGWTLTYEMFFYILVTAALVLHAPLSRICAPVMIAVAAFAVIATCERLCQHDRAGVPVRHRHRQLHSRACNRCRRRSAYPSDRPPSCCCWASPSAAICGGR